MLLSFVGAFVIALIVTMIACMPTTIHLHRAKTHMALVLSPIAEWVSKFVLWLTTGILTIEWVAVHRKHHAFTDEEGDPHSPELVGLWRVQLFNVLYYKREIRELRATGQLERYSRGVEEGWWDRRVFNHGKSGLAVGTAILVAVVGPFIGYGWALSSAGMHAVLYILLNSSVNGLGHAKGFKTFNNTATNIRWLAALTGGEGLHNNHHAYPKSPKLSYKGSQKWEFDPAWPIIKLLLLTGLASNCKETIEQMAV